ncbi:MAG: cytidylate kinase-like family protein [Lachnospiraceae bacterium]|nr:cytidylate kinase-like family protein [Lachnospiraceae bacterium]MEE1250273.1 cytidylate kinase-like family protein [Lachnospiraceae bacterium]
MEEKNYVITIARQFGSLGRKIGKRLASELDINYYDRDLIEKATEQMNGSIGELSKYDESIGGKLSKMLYPLGLGQANTHKKIYEFQKSMIKNIASHESCVIIGRCSDYILKDHPNAIHIFIHAPYEKRLENSVKQLGLDPVYAEKMIRDVDRAREIYHKFYTGEDFDTIANRNICIDSSLMSIDDTVKCLKQIVEIHFGLS